MLGSGILSLSSEAIDQTSKGKSAISNGARLFIEGLDGRTALARRYRDLVAEFVSDLGGADVISEAQRAIIRRAASLCVWCEAVEVQAGGGRGDRHHALHHGRQQPAPLAGRHWP